jgi:hypothetical protein
MTKSTKSHSYLIAITGTILSLGLGLGVSMILPSTTHNGISIIILTLTTVGIIWAFILRRKLSIGGRKMIFYLGISFLVIGFGLIVSQLNFKNAQIQNALDISDLDTAKLSVLMIGGNVFIPDTSDMQDLTGIALKAKVWNTGSPSVATEWSLTVTPKGKTPVIAQWTQMPETLTLYGTPNSTIIHSSDALDKKTAESPIGDTPIDGTLLFYVKIQKSVVLDPSTRLDLSVKDIHGGTGSDTHLMGDWLQR